MAREVDGSSSTPNAFEALKFTLKRRRVSEVRPLLERLCPRRENKHPEDDKMPMASLSLAHLIDCVLNNAAHRLVYVNFSRLVSLFATAGRLWPSLVRFSI